MDFNKSDVQSMLLDSAEKLLSDTSSIEYWREQRRSNMGFDQDRWLKIAELGWLALPLPEEAGGLNGTLEDITVLNIALGKALATEPYANTAVLAAHVFSHIANKDLSAELLSRIGSGELRVALAYQEANNEELASPDTVAQRTQSGYLLSGAKHLVRDAGSADKLIVTARLEDGGDLALFLVDVNAAGVTMERYPLVDGTIAADIWFEDADLPEETLLIAGEGGVAVLEEAIARAGIALMAQAVGAMEACLAVCGTYVKERRQFGVAIGSFQAIQHVLADMFVAAHQARSMLYQAVASSRVSPQARSAGFSAARIVIGQAGQLVSRNGIQVHGGYGLTDEYAVSHYFRRLMCLEKQYGDISLHIARYGDYIFDA